MRAASFVMTGVLMIGMGLPMPAAADPVRLTYTIGSGVSGNAFPFSLSPGSEFYYLGGYQQIYRGSAFARAVLIDSVAFMTDPRTLMPAEPMTSTFALSLGTTGVSQLAPMSSYEANRRDDLTEVFSGTLSVVPIGDGSFDFRIPLATPFLYVPGRGNLLLDIFVYGSSGGRGLAAGAAPDLGRVFNWGGTGESVGNGGYGLLTRISGLDAEPAPVPEPATMVLLGSGLAVLAAARRRKGPARLDGRAGAS